jgi:NADH:ubiquinone oxidoreductase subunit E
MKKNTHGIQTKHLWVTPEAHDIIIKLKIIPRERVSDVITRLLGPMAKKRVRKNAKLY